jgi:oligopeptide transport system substrate-binding protein
LPDLHRLTRDPHWGPLIERIPGLNLVYIILNEELPPLNDVRVRWALNYAVDRPRRLFAAARLFIPAGGLLPPVMPGYDPSIKGYAFDPDKARRLLAETGLPLPIHMSLWYPNDQITGMVVEGIQADLRQVGVEIELKPLTGSALTELVRTQGRAHIQMSCFMWNAMPDPSDIVEKHFDSRPGVSTMTSAWPIYSNQVVNQLITEAAPVTDLPKRFGLYREAERIIVADAPWLFLGYRNLFVLRQSWLKGPILEPTGFYRLDRTWIDR